MHAAAKDMKKLTKDLSRVLRTAAEKLSFCISSQISCSVLAGEGIIPVSLNLVSAATHQIATITAKDNSEKTIPKRLFRRMEKAPRRKPSANQWRGFVQYNLEIRAHVRDSVVRPRHLQRKPAGVDSGSDYRAVGDRYRA